MPKVIPIILSGGAGTRLWPVSRRLFPKPFLNVAGKPLLQHALERAALISDAAVIVTNQEHYFLTEDLRAKMPKLDTLDLSYLLEPEGRNTAPAIALATRHIQAAHGDDAVCLVLAADHLISDDAAFQKAVALAGEQASAGNLVVFGIRPSAPETGYGYIEVAAPSEVPQAVKKFVEKPDRETAERYLAAGRYYWNSGMFCFTAHAMAEALAQHTPDVWGSAQHVFAERTSEESVTRFDEAAFMAQPDISIDYAVMEKADNVTIVPASFGWSDVGSWDAVALARESDQAGNSAAGIADDKVMHVNSRNTHIESQSHNEKFIATISLDNLVIVDTPDALLIAKRDQSQQVKQVVKALKASPDAALTELPMTVHRPWGTYTTLKSGSGYQVKRIMVGVGHKLSLQYHHHRNEHWVVTQGTALVQVGDNEFQSGAGTYHHIPQGEKHRLSNIGDDTLVLIEVQYGDYLGEDDIVRLADVYNRD